MELIIIDLCVADDITALNYMYFVEHGYNYNIALDINNLSPINDVGTLINHKRSAITIQMVSGN